MRTACVHVFDKTRCGCFFLFTSLARAICTGDPCSRIVPFSNSAKNELCQHYRSSLNARTHRTSPLDIAIETGHYFALHERMPHIGLR